MGIAEGNRLIIKLKLKIEINAQINIPNPCANEATNPETKFFELVKYIITIKLGPGVIAPIRQTKKIVNHSKKLIKYLCLTPNS